jgi:ADP-heptose:LPS heptosyltransferase
VALRTRVVLVLRALGLGDLLTAVPALRALRDAFPRALLLLACPEPLHQLVRAWGLADETLDVRPLAPLPRRAGGADVAVNLHGRGPESTFTLLASRPSRLVAFAHPDLPATAGSPEWRDDEHEVGRWCRLLSEEGIPADPTRLDLPAPEGPPNSSGRVVVHPGAAAQARRWPPERWAAVARSQRVEGRDVVLTGSRDERELCLAIAGDAGLPPAAVLAGRTSLVELAGVVGRAPVAVSGDTGVAHLATALGAPSVVLFGPTSPLHWGPPADRPRHRVLWAGRTGDPHAASTDPGLLEIGIEDVRRAVAELLRD